MWKGGRAEEIALRPVGNEKPFKVLGLWVRVGNEGSQSYLHFE